MSASLGSTEKRFVTMHGHMNVKFLVRASPSHWTHRTRYYPSGRVISSSQRPITNNTRYSQGQVSMLPARFEPAIPGSEPPQTHALVCAATAIGLKEFSPFKFSFL